MEVTAKRIHAMLRTHKKSNRYNTYIFNVIPHSRFSNYVAKSESQSQPTYVLSIVFGFKLTSEEGTNSTLKQETQGT